MCPSFNIEKLNDGKPILERDPANPWENRVVFNPASVLIENKNEIKRITEKLKIKNSTKKQILSLDALCILIYRAQGEKTEKYDYRKSALGLAIFTPELELITRLPEPILKPDSWFDGFGVEDPRITKIGNKYYLIYTGVEFNDWNSNHIVKICLAVSDDLINWKKYGPLKGDLNSINNKNGVLFPEKINDKFVLLHRPMRGDGAMRIHLATADDIFSEWEDRGVLIEALKSEKYSSRWVGGGAPPIKISENRFLLIYHIGNMKPDNTREYQLGLAIVEKDKDRYLKIVKRCEPFMTPESEYEKIGERELGVDNVVFICGAYFYKDYLYLPYAGADSTILGARVKREEILTWALSETPQ